MINELMKNYQAFIGLNTDNDVIVSVMQSNSILVHRVYTSENLKCYKPDRRFFELILSENCFSPDEVIFVGDSISDDILGPKAIGIKTVWIDRIGTGGNHGQNYTICDFTRLYSVVKSI